MPSTSIVTRLSWGGLARTRHGALFQLSPLPGRPDACHLLTFLRGCQKADEACGAGLGERSDERVNTRNGYR